MWAAWLGPALLVVVVSAMALLWRDIAWRAKGQRRSLGSLLNHYLGVRVLGWLGRRQRRRLESDTRAVQRVQEETLLGRLRKNAETSYGRLHGFGSIQDGEEFRARHPLTGYEDYRELVERVAGGEVGALTAERPSVLALTSGTSGSCRMLLSTRDTSTEFFLQGVAVCLDAMQRAHPGTQSLQRTAKFFYNPTWRQSEAGIPIGPNSSTPRSSRQLLSLYTTPAPAFEVPTEPEALYLHLLFAVKDPSLGTLESNFASTIYYAFCALQERWRELAEDVELGRVRPELAVPQEVRRDLDSRCHIKQPNRNQGVKNGNIFVLHSPRYRLGDVVRVVGFHNQCPVVEFQYRRGQMLSVRGEKVSEELFYGALQRAVSLWPGAELVDYCCAESGILGHFSGGSDPHYQVFLELRGVRNLSEEQRYKLDHCLQEDSAIYKSFRFKGSIGPMRVQLVRGGAFQELRSHMLASSQACPNTFKMHRVLRRKEFVQFIQGRIIS
nr:PREDICTED: GH3 domain-containing protein [Lepisosteus oculatus]